MIGGEHLVARREREGAQHRVHAAGGIGDEGKVVGVGAYEVGEARPGGVEAAFEVTAQEEHRLGLQLGAERGLMLEHGLRTGSIRAVIQKRDGGIERPERREIGRSGHRRSELRAA
jgi:hypothetical protein